MKVLARYLKSQFADPRGPIGWLVGWILAWENRERNHWAAVLLDPQPTDRVLEVGCGPGVALQAVLARVTRGRVAAIDRSAVMVRMAAQRNAAAVADGRLTVQTGTAEHLPFPAAAFDRALAVNSLHIWQDQGAGLAELRRVLRPGGTLVIVQQPWWRATDAEVDAMGRQLVAALTAAGFADVRLESRPMKPATTLAAIGQHPTIT